jgi:sulfate adenylyltransferase
MIKPHGADTLKPLYVSDAAERARLTAEAANLPALLISSAAAGNAVMLGAGYFHSAHWLHESGRQFIGC